jgi:hypothetical protein
VSMSLMAASIVRELRIMHVMASHETYMTTSNIMTHALGGITKLHFVII